jgi:CHAD domain-containing protein
MTQEFDPPTEEDPNRVLLEQAGELKSPGVLPDDPLSEAGRKVLRFHFLLMLKNEAGTRLGEDIEALHDMRVATRRMRSAFDIFGPTFKPKALQRYLRGLRATGRALGRVRDLDVILEKAGHYLETLPEEGRSGLDPLLDSWRQERGEGRQSMLEYLDSPAYDTFKFSFFDFLNKPGAGARKNSPPLITLDGGEEREGGYTVQEAAPLLVYTRLSAVRRYEQNYGPGLEDAPIETLHALRIEFKKFRYTVEFFRETLGLQAKNVIEDLKCMQDHLGDLNDAQVATLSLQAILAGWDKRQEGRSAVALQSPEAVAAYLAYRHAERHHLRQTFGEAWAQFNRPEFRKNLALALSVL